MGFFSKILAKLGIGSDKAQPTGLEGLGGCLAGCSAAKALSLLAAGPRGSPRCST